MIKLKRLNGKEFVVNCDLIEFIESTPDTVITLITGNKIVVNDTIDEIIKKVIKYKKSTHPVLKLLEKKEVFCEEHNR